jgi:hypothetical protein
MEWLISAAHATLRVLARVSSLAALVAGLSLGQAVLAAPKSNEPGKPAQASAEKAPYKALGEHYKKVEESLSGKGVLAQDTPDQRKWLAEYLGLLRSAQDTLRQLDAMPADQPLNKNDKKKAEQLGKTLTRLNKDMQALRAKLKLSPGVDATMKDLFLRMGDLMKAMNESNSAVVGNVRD